MSQLVIISFGRGVVLVNFEVAPAAIEDLILTLIDYMLLQLAERLGRATAAKEWTPDNHVALTLSYMRESVLELEYLIAMAAFYSNLVYDVIEIAILIFRNELALALATFRATLVEPLLYTGPMEDLFAIGALHRTV